jgi:glutathione synthase/RimK-type ligase-like ATP-grasp enzyme
MARIHFVRIIRELTEELGIETETYSNDWGFRLKKDGKTRYLVGYHFPLNRSSAKELCQDKSLTYDALRSAGIPAVPHVFVPSVNAGGDPDLEKWRPFLEELIETTGYAVVKDNYGTGGNRVFRYDNADEAIAKIAELHKMIYGAAVSPWQEIREEYRVTMLMGEPQLVIRKERRSRILPDGTKQYVEWRHNLGLGAVAYRVTDPEILEKVEEMAARAAEAVDMRFASVDIIDTKEGLRVLEINAGVMMEHFAGQDEESFETAKAIYRKALLKSFED